MPENSKVESCSNIKKSCMACGNPLKLNNKRDIERKKFCSKSCKSKHDYSKCVDGGFGKVTKDRIDKQSKRMKEVWKTKKHPMLGRKHSDKTKTKISDSQKYRLRLNPEKILRGERNPNWKGGKKHNRSYVEILKPDHPKANSEGYVREHVVIAEKKIGRALLKNEVVHHINGIKDDNRPDNLSVMDRGEHTRWHRKIVA